MLSCSVLCLRMDLRVGPSDLMSHLASVLSSPQLLFVTFWRDIGLRTETCGTLLVMRLCDADSMSLLQRSCSWRQGWVCVKDALFLLLCSIHRCSVPCAAGVACLHLEQQLAAALEDDSAQMAKAEARASESRRVLQVLDSLPLFRGGGRGPLAELVVSRPGCEFVSFVNVRCSRCIDLGAPSQHDRVRLVSIKPVTCF